MATGTSENGLVIGKFLPPHAGHLHLIEEARRQVRHLYVLLFSKASEPIPGSLREAWLRRLVSGVTLLHSTESHPVNYKSAVTWDLWIAAIRRACPATIDVVFSSENYGDELAKRLGARHVLVDPVRQLYPVSGTAIRAHPHQQWDYLPPPVRGYYAHRIAIIGAESTGKTTLAQDLAAALQIVWVPEFARDYLEVRNGVCAWEDFEPIARGQLAAEDNLAEQCDRVLVCDTTLRVTRAWSEHYFGRCQAWITEAANERTYALHLVTGLDVPWQADALRDCPHGRHLFHERFVRELEAAQLPYVLVTGDREARVRQALDAMTAKGIINA